MIKPQEVNIEISQYDNRKSVLIDDDPPKIQSSSLNKSGRETQPLV